MKIATFIIDDSSEEIGNELPFKAVYILYGEDIMCTRYVLKDWKWNDIDINTLNGYQLWILHGCQDCFVGDKHSSFGVTHMSETIVESEE